ncbi:MAG: zf-HC2 domain-containing protein [Gemmatimonadota bacterium]|nr:zf-HC2 domain-containing protein [Gemmatimonadota bacterium]
MSDLWTDRLSEYLDGELSPGEGAELEAHLADCTECFNTLGELRMVVQRARALPTLPPRTNLWPGIAARLGNRQEWRLAFSVPQLIAASLILLLAGGMGSWLLLPRAPTESTRVVVRPVPVREPAGVLPASFADPRYDAAVVDLERVLAEHRYRLDPGTVRVLEENLAIMDQAIASARAALARDPASAFLSAHLADAMQRKLKLLRDAGALVTES